MQERKLTIYFTSDLHSYIYPTDYRSQKEQDLGLFKCASQFQKDGNTLIIDGGDLLQARRSVPSVTIRSAARRSLPRS